MTNIVLDVQNFNHEEMDELSVSEFQALKEVLMKLTNAKLIITRQIYVKNGV